MKMKSLMICCGLTGLVVAIAGLVCEFLKVDGLRNYTGYVHLRMFDSFFYALGSKRAVVTTVFFLNFCIGATLGGMLWAVFRLVRKACKKRNSN